MLFSVNQNSRSAGSWEVLTWRLDAGSGKPTASDTFTPAEAVHGDVHLAVTNSRLAVSLPLVTRQGLLRILDRHGKAAPVQIETPTRCAALSAAPNGTIWGGWDDELQQWDPATGKGTLASKNRLGVALRGVADVTAVTAGRDWVIAGMRDGDVRVFPVQGAGERAMQAMRHVAPVPVRSTALLAGESLALAGADDGSMTLLGIPEGEVVQQWRPHRDQVTSLAVGSEGVVASGSRDGTVRLWQLRGKVLAPLFTLRHARPISQIAWESAPASRLFVLEQGSRGCRVWHLDRLRERLEQMGLGAGIP